jgi:hypothetical protein
MDDKFIKALQAAKNPEDKAALIAEANIETLSNEEALVARQCILFHWFDQSIIEGLLQALPSHTVNSQDIYEQITLLSFIEQTSWGIRYQDLTRQGLLKYCTSSKGAELKGPCTRRGKGACRAASLQEILQQAFRLAEIETGAHMRLGLQIGITVGKTINSPFLTYKFVSHLSLIGMSVPFFLTHIFAQTRNCPINLPKNVIHKTP